MDVKISAGADPVTLVATDKVPMARSASTTAYAATMAELASFANTAYVPNYYTGTPSMDATGAPGSAAFVSRGDHVHPSDTTRVAKGGDTMTGLLTLSGAPTANLHAATKLYVDGSAPVGGPYLPLAGGVLTGAVTPSQTAGLVGTTTNNNASAGSVGEFINANVGLTVPVSSGVSTNILTLALTAGDWDVWAELWANPSGGNIVGLGGGINTVSATIPAGPGANTSRILINVNASTAQIAPVVPCRISLAASGTAYLVASIQLSAGTCSAGGSLSARRRR